MKITFLFAVITLTVVLHLRAQTPIPPKGTVFNESEWLSDSIKGRKVLRLTKNRDFNQTPTYHIFTGFSGDSRYLIFASWNKGGQSALLKGDMVTGDITGIDWNQSDSQGVPVLNVLGAHNSGNHSFGQHTHPHCLMSPDGKYLSYNKGSQSKSDVYVMTVR